MNKLYRSLLLAGIVAVGLAGCGDDVTVVDPPPPPPPPTPQVRGVSVTPDGVTVQPNDKIQMSANVSADPGVGAVNIAWSVSDGAKASVDAQGLVTIAAAATAGPVSIKATATCSTDCGSASGAATLNVVSTTANAPIVSIGAIQFPNGVTAPLGAAAGQLQAVVNLDRQGQIINSLELLAATATDTTLLGNGPVGAPALVKSAGDQVNAFEPITIPFNSAAFTCTSTGCTPMLLNQAYTLLVRVNWGAANNIKTSGNTSITFANPSGFFVTASVDGPPVLDSRGLTWQGGNLTVLAQGVIYTPGGLTVSQVTILPGVNGLASATLTPANPSNTWSSGTSIASGGSRSYETNAFAGPDCVIVTGSSLSNGQPGPLVVINRSANCGGPVNSAAPDNFMLDNKAPNGGKLVLTEQGTVNNASTSPACCFLNWIGAAYTPASGHTNAAGSAGATAGAITPSDGGSGAVSPQTGLAALTTKYFAGAPTAISPALGISAGTEFTKGSDLQNSPQFPGNASLTIVAEVKDAVGNTTLVGLSPSANAINPLTTMGVDNDAPTGAALAPGAATANRAVATGAFPAPFTFSQTAQDALSGFGTLQAQRRIYHNFFENGQVPEGVTGFGLSNTAGTSWLARIGAFAHTLAAAPAQGVGYYTSETTARDKGGNLDPNLVVQELLWDGAPPTVINVTANPQNTGALLSGQIPTQYGFQANDDVDLAATAAFINVNQLVVAGTNPLIHRGNGTFVGQWGLPLDRTANTVINDVIVRTFQNTLAGPITTPTQVWGAAMDIAGWPVNIGTNLQFVPLAAPALAAPVGAAAGWGVTAFTLAAPGGFGGALCSGNGPPGNCPAGTPSSVTLTLTATGAGVPQNPGYANVPFIFTELHWVDPSNPIAGAPQAWTLSRNSVANAGVGLYTWSLTIDATQLAAVGATNFFAVALTPDGDMLMSNLVGITVL